jgi:hypothetical protein
LLFASEPVRQRTFGARSGHELVPIQESRHLPSRGCTLLAGADLLEDWNVHVDITQRFAGAALADVEQLYMRDEAFNERVFSDHGIRRRVVQNESRGDTLVRTLRLCPLHGLPAPFSALLRGGIFYVCEQVEYDRAAHRGSWCTHPSLLGHQFRASGAFWFEHDDGGGVTFRLEGHARASIPFLSRKAEKHAVHTAEQQHAALAEAVRVELGLAPSAESAA